MYAIVMTDDNYPIKVFTDRDQAEKWIAALPKGEDCDFTYPFELDDSIPETPETCNFQESVFITEIEK